MYLQLMVKFAKKLSPFPTSVEQKELQQYEVCTFYIKYLFSVLLIKRVYHLKCNPPTVTYCGTKIKSEAGPPRVIVCPHLSCDTRVKVTQVARHQNCLLLAVNHLAMHILTRKYRIRQQYTDW
jgi:hypothetical protein